MLIKVGGIKCLHIMENKNIIFYVGEETKPVVENLDRYKQSIFNYQIDKSIHLIDEHLCTVTFPGKG